MRDISILRRPWAYTSIFLLKKRIFQKHKKFRPKNIIMIK